MTDIEDLCGLLSFKKGNFIPEDIKEILILFVKELCSEVYDHTGKVQNKMTHLRKKYHISPKKSQISYIYESLLENGSIEENINVRKTIKSKEMRGLSGVIVISVITSPYPEYTDKQGKKKKTEV